jgi:hypothetical protein
VSCLRSAASWRREPGVNSRERDFALDSVVQPDGLDLDPGAYPLLSFDFSLKLGHFDPPVHPVSSRLQDVRLDL